MLSRLFFTRALRLAGWRYEGPLPAPTKYVCLAYPHTSNWDGVLMVAMAQSVGLKMSWMMKSDWFRGPLGPVMRAVGAVAVDRSQRNNVVDQMVAEFARRQQLVLTIPPEGTRKHAQHWRSGFYHIARGAGVPVVPGYLDYGRKQCGMGEPISLTGDVRADMDRIRAFYARRPPTGLKENQVGPIRLREEDHLADLLLQ